MDTIASILANRKELPKSRLSTQVQVEAFEVWEHLLDKKIEVRILLRLAKLNLPLFLKAKRKLKAVYTDGKSVNNKVSYFLWLYKQK